LLRLKWQKKRERLLYGIVNVVGSSIARFTHCGSYTHAGPEIGVASTKAFTVPAYSPDFDGIKSGTQKRDYLRRLFQATGLCSRESIPEKVEKVLQSNEKIKSIAKEIKDVSNALYLGRGYNFPVALEGALKSKEISYIHAEGYPAAEMKHGPIALD
jgi:glucosamine--fructose-6-phosphate aminotransferase (isomerizing)